MYNYNINMGNNTLLKIMFFKIQFKIYIEIKNK